MVAAMNTTWRERLERGLKDLGVSKRAASLKAELGPGYVHSILAEGKEPTVDNLIKVCEAAGLSATWVVFGYAVTPEIEELARLYAAAPEEMRTGIRSILTSHRAP
jgi:hypothetical protein